MNSDPQSRVAPTTEVNLLMRITPLTASPRRLLATVALFLCTAVSAQAGGLTPAFSKAFLPATIGPGSVSRLHFSITNTDAVQVTTLAFNDNLPAGVTIAMPANASFTCGGTLSAPGGGGTISFSGGSLAPASACTVDVDVTSAVAGSHSNISGNLTSSAGNSGPAAADLIVATDRPGFSKAFSPSTVNFGGRSTLTFTIDNSASASLTLNMNFTDSLPLGLVIADPANAATNCASAALSAVPGSTLVGFSTGIVAAGATCTVSVDVRASAFGLLVNSSGELNSTIAGPTRSSGKANAAIAVTGSTVALIKDFPDDPVNPGSPVTLQFTLINFDRNFDATGISFTDDLNATLTGLVATGLPLANPCGAGSLLTGTSLLTLTSGNLAADGGTCTFSLTLQVPVGATAGAYLNTTSAVSAMIDGAPVVGSPGSETLYVNDAPQLTKTFLTNPVGAGGTTLMEFTITNTSATSAATGIAFSDDLDAFLSPRQFLTPPPAGFCGAGSTLTVQTIGVNQHLVLAGGNLAAGGSCTFSANLGIPAGTAGGDYVNTTSPISATVNGTTQMGHSATATLTVVNAPRLRKSFLDDPVLPGGTVTLQFTLDYDAFAAGPATAITFTDDLDATLSGLVAVGLPANNVCGAGSQLSGTGLLTLTGGTLAPGGNCVFTVTLQVPAGAAAGFHVNNTSSVTATASGVTATNGPAQDRLLVSGLFLSKTFLGDPVIPGATASLQFTIDNSASSDAATAISFSDNLNSTLSGLAATGVLPATPCGAGSTITGTTNLSLTGGNLAAGATCTFTVTVQIPAGAANGDYVNTTSNLIATINAVSTVLPPATDVLTVSGAQILLSKSFTDDPVAPGGIANLQFTVTNLNPAQAATAIAFTDDLDAVLSGLVAVGLPTNDVCGVGSQFSGSGLLSLTGGSLAAGAFCTFSVSVMVPAAAPGGSFVNTTSTATATMQGLGVTGDPASDTLQITAVNFSKAFASLAGAGGTVQLQFALENLDILTGVGTLTFLDDLSAVLPGLVATGLPANDICGAGSQLTGTSSLTLTGGTLAAGGSCLFSVTLQVPAGAAPGSYPNVTSVLTAGGLGVAEPATASLGIEPAPTFAKSFAPPAIAAGQVSTLTFTIDNTASALAAGSLDFTDNLPAGTAIAAAPNTSTTCTGGTLTAVAGSGAVSYTGGTVGAGASCTVTVDVTGVSAGVHVNVSGALTSSSGNSGTATADLTVSGSLLISKVFVANPVLPGGTILLEYTITNPDAAGATAITFTDDLDAAISGLVASGLPAADLCGAGSQLAGTSLLSFTGGSLAGGASCTFSAAVIVPASAAPSTYPSTSGPVSGLVGGVPAQGNAATADLVVVYLDFSKFFTDDPALIGQTTGLTFTIVNPDLANAVTGLTFTDDLDSVLSGLAAVGTPLNDVCGFGSQLAGMSLLTLTNGSLAAGGSCTFTVDVAVPQSAPTDATFTNLTSGLDATVGGSAVTGGPASAATADLHTGADVVAIPALSTTGMLLLAGFLALLGWKRFGR